MTLTVLGIEDALNNYAVTRVELDFGKLGGKFLLVCFAATVNKGINAK